MKNLEFLQPSPRRHCLTYWSILFSVIQFKIWGLSQVTMVGCLCNGSGRDVGLEAPNKGSPAGTIKPSITVNKAVGIDTLISGN